MTRILHVLDHSVPIHSGYSFRTLAILREQRRLGWETAQLTSPKHEEPGEAEEDVDGFRFHRTQWKPSVLGRLPVIGECAQMRATARRLEEVARVFQPEILHAHSPVLNALPALWVGHRLGIPVVYEVRAFWEDAAVDHGTSREWGVRYRLTRGLETWALRGASQVTTICDGLRRDVVARGIAEDRVTVIPNAVDVSAFAFGAKPDLELKAQLGLEGCTVIGFLGSFYGYEGLDLLLEAMPRVAARQPEVRILLVGGGPQEPALKMRASALGISDKVVFAGRVPHDAVQRYYSIVDVFAYPRRSIRLTQLVTPLKPLEAMALGGLVVASDVGGHRELIRDGETGFLFRADDVDALAEILQHALAARDSWPRIREAGRRFVETERTWRKSVAGYAAVYAALQEGVNRSSSAAAR